MIKAGADVEAKNELGFTPLILAVMVDNPEIVKLLIKAGANIEATDDDAGRTALQHAVVLPHVSQETAKVLIKAGADVNGALEDGDTLLMRAAACGKAEIVKLLAKQGLDVNQTNDKGSTALMKAAAVNKESCRMLAFSEMKWRPVGADATDCVKALLKLGADPRTKNKKGETALSLAEKAGNAEVVKMLSKKK